MTFAPGVGLLIDKSSATVLQVVIRGTPRATTAWGSLLRFSRSRVRFLPPLDIASAPRADQNAAAITELLHRHAHGALTSHD